MIEDNTTSHKVSTKVLFIWSIGLLAVSFVSLYIIRYQHAHTFCHRDAGCSGLNTASDIVQPIGAIIFLAGLILLITTIVLAITRRAKK